MFAVDLTHQASVIASSVLGKVESTSRPARTAFSHSNAMISESYAHKLADINSVVLSNSVYFLKFKLGVIEAKKTQMRFSAIEQKLLQRIEKFLVAVKTVQPREIIEQCLLEVSSLWIKANKQQEALKKKAVTDNSKDFFTRLMTISEQAEKKIPVKENNLLARLNELAKEPFGECFAWCILGGV